MVRGAYVNVVVAVVEAIVLTTVPPDVEFIALLYHVTVMLLLLVPAPTPHIALAYVTLKFAAVAPWQYVAPPVKAEIAVGYLSFTAKAFSLTNKEKNKSRE